MPFTNYANQRLVLQLFGTPFTPPANWFVALSTTTPTQQSADDWNFTEPSSGDAYSRVQVAATPDNWGIVSSPPGNGYALWNINTITFSQASAPWGDITCAGLWDQMTGGNLWGFLVLKNILDVQAASIVYFVPNTLVVTNN